jgi:hypothetical protein
MAPLHQHLARLFKAEAECSTKCAKSHLAAASCHDGLDAGCRHLEEG